MKLWQFLLLFAGGIAATAGFVWAYHNTQWLIFIILACITLPAAFIGSLVYTKPKPRSKTLTGSLSPTGINGRGNKK
jgi:hypothetical protein